MRSESPYYDIHLGGGLDAERRTLYRHGALLLLLSALLGLVTAAPVPHAAKWMTAHVSGLMTGILIIALGAVWSELRLTPSRRLLAMRLGLTSAWLGLFANTYSAIFNLPGPVTDPGRQPDAAWQLPVLFVLLAVIIPSTLVSFFLVWRGLSK
jgi:(hydroxyamino)benzene mutase